MEQNNYYHRWLISSYFFNKSVYALSFTNRMLFDLDCLTIQPRTHSKELDKLSDKDLEEKIEALKVPWWNDIYEKKIKPDHELSEAIYRIFLEELKSNKEKEQASYGIIVKLKRILNCLFHNKK